MRTEVRRPCARCGRATRAAAEAVPWSCSRLTMRCVSLAGGEPEPVLERGPQDGEAVPAPPRRARQVDDERAAAEAGGAAREQRVRRPCERVRPDRLRDPRRLPVEDRPCGLWR